MDLTVWILISALFGARMMYVLFHLDEFKGRWIDVISPVQSDGTLGIAGLVIFGGVIAAVPVAAWFLKRKKIPLLKMTDILIPSLTLGIALGRIGCFLNGCCHGIPTELPWGVEFPESCIAGSVFQNQAIHPSQLYETIYSFIIMGILLIRSRTRLFVGELSFIFLVLYGLARFINETIRFYRSSMIMFNIGSLDITISMMISLAMFLTGIILLVRGYKNKGNNAKG